MNEHNINGNEEKQIEDEAAETGGNYMESTLFLPQSLYHARKKRNKRRSQMQANSGCSKPENQIKGE